MMDKKNGAQLRDHKSEGESRHKEAHTQSPDGTASTPTPKKRRKVNHACVYCRRSHMTCDLERPCTRCIKRNIGHLCHDEPRDPDVKKTKGSVAASAADDSESHTDLHSQIDQNAGSMRPPSFDAGAARNAKSTTNASALARANPLQLVQPGAVTNIQPNALDANNLNQFAGFSDAWLTAQNHYHDMQNYHPQYGIVPEVSNELNFLNDFLHQSLLDDGGVLQDDQSQAFGGNQSDLLTGFANSGSAGGSLLPSGSGPSGSMLPPSTNADHAKGITRPTSVVPIDKAREYYLQAADPAGNDTPEERMSRVLTAKYEAGLLKPFNYIKGYQRLSSYLDSHVIAPTSKQSILRQLDRFRPKFREKMQNLSDIELIYVEMWFEKTLMEYDRVFASMAVPACCWRRTGEIFRGNKEMAELIHVPVERLRDGNIALHEILTEESMVRYWEEFGTIAFDSSHDTLLTACSLKSPDDQSNEPIVKCCFSLKIRRDEHKIPSMIIGNFLPHDPVQP